MRQLLNTLYVTSSPSYLHLDHERVRLEVDDETEAEIPLHHLGAIVCFGNVMISPALMGKCAEDGRTVTFLSWNGRFQARVVGPASGNVLLRKAQFAGSEDAEITRPISRAIVAGKIQNSRHVLQRGARERDEDPAQDRLREAVSHLGQSLHRLEQAETLDTIRGIEGEAARQYFEVFSELIRQQREDFSMETRTRRPPRDRVNALLSFLYSLLLNDCTAAAEGVGLDGQVGFLHAVRPGRPAMGLDLMEELRAYLADRTALTLINRKQIGPDDFRNPSGGAVLLNESGRKTVLSAYQKRKQTEITHPFLDQEMEIGLIPHAQARLMARTLQGEMDRYPPFLIP